MAGKGMDGRILRNSVFLYVRMFFLMLLSFFSVRLVLGALGVEDYGIYNAVGGIAVSLNVLFSVLESACHRFFSVSIAKEDKGELATMFRSFLLAYVLIILFFVVIAETAGLYFVSEIMNIPSGKEDAAMVVFQFTIVTFASAMFSMPFRALIISYEDMGYYTLLSVIDGVLKFGSALFLLFVDEDLMVLYSAFLACSSVFTMLAYIFVCRRKYTDVPLGFRWSKSIFSSIMSFSGWTMVGTVAGICHTQGLNMLINVFSGPVANAAFAVSTQVSVAVNTFAASFFTAVKPPIIKEYANANTGAVTSLFYVSSKMLFILVFVIILPVIMECETLLSLWLGRVEDYMVSFTCITLVYVLVQNMGSPITAIAHASGRVKLYHCMADGFAAVLILVSYVVLKAGYSPNYAITSSVIAFVVAHCFRLYVLKRVMYFSYVEYVRNIVLPAFFCTALSTSLSVAFKFYVSSNVFLVLCFSVIIVLLTGFFCVLNSHEKQYIVSFIKK